MQTPVDLLAVEVFEEVQMSPEECQSDMGVELQEHIQCRPQWAEFPCMTWSAHPWQNVDGVQRP